MIFYCAKTGEYLADILDRASRGAEHFLQIDVQQNQAKALIQKWTVRYKLDQTARQRTYRLKTKPVVDLIMLQNQSLKKARKIRLCLLVTMPVQNRGADLKTAHDMLNTAFDLDKSQHEKFNCMSDRKSRLTCNVAIVTVKADAVSVPVYELVELPFTKAERKQKEITKDIGWTWRLHKDFIKLKLQLIEDSYKEAQKVRDPLKQDAKLLKQFEILWSMSGFRGVRDDIFKLNSKASGLSFRYLNRKNTLELKVPLYTIKMKKLAKNFDEMVAFNA